MRAKVLIALALSFALAGCYSRTVEERQPVVMQQPQQQPTTTIVTPPATTVVCPAGSVC